MRLIPRAVGLLAVLCMGGLAGCSSDDGTGENQSQGVLTGGRGEHDRDGGEHHGEGREHDGEGGGEHDEGGEESGRELGLEDAYDEVRNGARLKLAYDLQANSFKGTVENTASETLHRVRVEVHLSTGKELGPTTPSDLAPGEKRNVELTATKESFDGWTAHPEVGSAEHGHGGDEGGGEHGREGGGQQENKESD